MENKEIVERLERIINSINSIERASKKDSISTRGDDMLTHDEVKMVCNQIDTMVMNAVEIKHIIEMTQKAPAWVESKISVCSAKISSVRNYLIGKITDV